jgi:hypothetical protein
MTTDELDQLARELWYKRNETFGGSGEDCIKVNVLMLWLNPPARHFSAICRLLSPLFACRSAASTSPGEHNEKRGLPDWICSDRRAEHRILIGISWWSYSQDKIRQPAR